MALTKINDKNQKSLNEMTNKNKILREEIQKIKEHNKNAMNTEQVQELLEEKDKKIEALKS